ncbi:MAG TPA: hypothetical protein VMT63_09705 [Bacteroidales bacterium]|nr:hypothetical protein [Bacteroidales bacterium]
MDKLESFVRENRADLDKLEPPDGSWENIRSGIRRGKVAKPAILAAAAVIVILAGISSLVILHRKNNSMNINSSYQQELKESEVFYNTLYNNIYNQAKPLLTGQPDVDREIRNGAARIDSLCFDLKRDLRDNVANREVIESLIRNYRIKIRLLEEMLNAVKQNEKDIKKESHEL